MGRYRAKDSAAPHPSGLRTLSKGEGFFFSKKGLLFWKTYDTMLRVPGQNIGMSPSGKAPDFDSGIRRFKSGHPSQHDPLAQLAEQLPFKQWVRGSNPRRVTKQKEVIAFGGGLFSFRWSEGIRTHSIKLPVAAWKPPAGRGFSIVYSNPRRVTKNRQALFGLADFYLFTLHFSLFTRYRGRFLGSNR